MKHENDFTDDQIERAAEVLISLDHTDDYIRAFGAEMSELEDWEANAARHAARLILEATLG